MNNICDWLKDLTSIKKIILCVCIKWTHLLYSLQKKIKNDVEVIEYGGEIWINQKYLEKNTWFAKIADRSQYYSSIF